jgi:hypothetical protein
MSLLVDLILQELEQVISFESEITKIHIENIRRVNLLWESENQKNLARSPAQGQEWWNSRPGLCRFVPKKFPAAP